MLLQATPAQAIRYATLAQRRYQSYCQMLGLSAFSMLEIGCGPGELGAEFTKLGVDYHGVNIDIRIVEAGQRRMGDRIKQRDFLKMEMDRGYDMVCFHQVLEHITEPRLFAKRVRECSWPGGGLHGDVPNMTGLSALLHQIIPMDSSRFGAIILPHHQLAYAPKTIHNLFGQTFRLKTFDVKINDPTWGQVNELGCAMRAYSAVSGVLNAGTNLAFIGKRIEFQ
jgi:2-polyprenyl-3-methyl-5-hydroxy-6-metoxy-1,4-benzoquinol methylase